MEFDFEDVGNRTAIEEQLDIFFELIGVSSIEGLSIIGIVGGLCIAFFGGRGYGPKVLAFLSGCIIGLYISVILLGIISTKVELDNEVYIGSFIASGVIGGILAVCVVIITKIVIGIATGLIVSGVFFQLGVAEIIEDRFFLLFIVTILCVVSIYLVYKVVDIIYALLASFLGASFVIIGIGYFTNSPITLNLITSDPTQAIDLCRVADSDCYIPLISGMIIIVISFMFNLGCITRKNRRHSSK